MLLVYIHRTRSDFVLSARSTYTRESTFLRFSVMYDFSSTLHDYGC
jgi:hypothetical protein